MILPATPTVVQDIVDDQALRELWIVGREHERPPYFHAGKGGDMRLAKALRVVQEGRITPNSDGSYTVEGSEGRTYRCDQSCSCPQSQKGPSKHCYHMVATALYIEWRKRCATLTAPPLHHPVSASALAEEQAEADDLEGGSPVDDETLPLPLPPTTIEERLATPAREEVPMTEDPSPYIPEPDEAAVAVLESAAPPPTRVTIPAEYVMHIQGRRHVLYAGLVIGAQHSGLVSLSADWTYNDADLSLAHAVATFADGRRYEDSGDASPSNVTKSVAKHFRRVALTRAKARCLRDALGIQECAVEELAEAEGRREVPDLTPPQARPDLKRRIWQLVKQHDPTITTREACEASVLRMTGLALEPDNYGAIVNRLTEEGR